MIGQTLSHFKVTAKLGQGGMGEVYRAEDTKLGREVAVKVLPEAFVADAERLARFEREAKVLAALDHPNIAGIYEIGEHEGARFLAMQLVDGEDLAARLSRGPLPVPEALDLALQIAKALEAAHEKGVVHRDLKPANIMVSSEGAAKVLDFGLAKSRQSETDPETLSRSPTLTAGMTRAGVILGTAAYMSPEQARGQEVDKQADIWAFAAVLFEMLAGKRPFEGQTITDTLAAILEREPDWTLVPKNTPPLVRRAIRRGLEKDPRRRTHEIADARFDLEDAQNPGMDQDEEEATAPVGRVLLPWALSGVLALLAGTAFLLPGRTPSTAGTLVRASLNLPLSHQQPQRGRAMALSPDGKYLVYLSGGAPWQGGVADISVERQLHVWDLAAGETNPIPGTIGAASAPFFSLDGTWIGFATTEGRFRKVSLEDVGTGAVSDDIVFDPWGDRGVSWAPDGSIVVGQLAGGLRRVSADGSVTGTLTTLDTDWNEESHRWPDVLPNGRGVLYSAKISGNFDDSRIMMYDLESGESHFLLNASEARYAPTGHLIYAEADTLFAAPFDAERMELIGKGVPVQKGVVVASAGPGSASFTFSNNGTLVYLARPAEDRRLVMIDLAGNAEPVNTPLGRYQAVRFSPDGQRLALSVGGDTAALYEVYSYELEQERMSLLTSRFEDSTGTEFDFKGGLAFHPDGKSLTINGTAPGEQQILFSIALDGGGAAERLTEPPAFHYPGTWSSDGKHLLFVDEGLHEVSPETGESRAILEDAGVLPHAHLSRDMQWLAYESCEGLQCEVFLTSYPQARGRHQVSLEGGRTPQWAPDGKTLYFIDGTRMMAADIQTSPVLSIGKPHLLFEGDFYSEGAGMARGFDLSPDGRRFVMIENVSSVELNKLQIVLNWFDEVNRLAPGTGRALLD